MPTKKTQQLLASKNQSMVDSLRSTVPLKIPEAPVEKWDFEKQNASIINTTNNSKSLMKGGKSVQSKSIKTEESKDVKSGQTKKSTEKSDESSAASSSSSKKSNSLIYSFSFSCERSWVSHSFCLHPGEYIIMCHTKSFREETPNVFPGVPDSIESDSHAHGHKKGSHIQDDDSTEKGIWAHASSTSQFKLSPVDESTRNSNLDQIKTNSLDTMAKNGMPTPERWPFMIEQQHDVASRGLIEVMTKLRKACNDTNAEMLKCKYPEYNA